ncbi:MAG: DEAD/DEAH box helicase [Bacteroidaceae bacterium]|nr:DEAD/DEAH box helicase [Bacteroidaceae bacterium]
MTDFKELGLRQELLRAIEEQGYEHPMPVQEQVIPWLLENTDDEEAAEEIVNGKCRDLVALAQTGTGKTAAYGLPLLQLLKDLSQPPLEGEESLQVQEKFPRPSKEGRGGSSPSVLILSPTRELCLQIADDLQGFAKYMPEVRILAVYGGANIEPQIRALKHGVDIIVATPGRLVDLMTRKKVAVLDDVRYLVLDEADEMLSMGFQEDLDTILEGVPEEHRTLLFSATMSKEIERIAKKYLKDSHEIQIGSRNEGAENVNHVYYMVQAKDKYLALKRVVDYYPRIYAIIFCRTRMETQEVADALIRDGYNADALHGELSQQQRDLTMQRFRQHRIQLLVATDVAARGLDVDDLTHVINYGMPDDVEYYTHRSGRTGRAGKKGTSISIVHIREKNKIRQIEKVIKKEFVRQSLPEPKEICGKQLYHVIDEIERVEVDEEQIAPFMEDVQKRWAWLDKDDIVKRILSREFGRFLRYYASAPEIEEVSESKAKSKDQGARSKGQGARGKKGDHTAEEGYTRLFLSVSKIDGFFAKDIIKLINDKVKGRKVEIGRIDLLKNISFVEVAEEDADRVVKGLKGTRVKGREVVVDYADNPNHSAPSKGGDSKKKDRKKDKKKEQYPTDFFDEPVGKKKEKKGKSSPSGGKKGTKPSREERGYTEPRGKKFKKEDWMKFLHPELNK